MKCEHEGCEEEAEGMAEVVISFPYDKSGRMCKSHLAAWLREKADEVEGVKECPECHGGGGWIQGNIIDGYRWFPCTRRPACNDGKVPR